MSAVCPAVKGGWRYGAPALVALAVASPPAGVPPALGPASAEVPVLLVPGWLDTDRDLAALRIRLNAAGWPGDAVSAIGFADPTGSNRAHAREIDEAVRALRRTTGADRIDIVAHSMGGLAVRWYLLTTSDAPVRRVAFLASPHHGTYAAVVAWGEGADEMEPHSAFLDTLNAAPPVPEGVEAITVRTPLDTRIVPGESAELDGVPDHTVCCPTHQGLLRDDEVFGIIVRFLRGADSASSTPGGGV